MRRFFPHIALIVLLATYMSFGACAPTRSTAQRQRTSTAEASPQPGADARNRPRPDRPLFAVYVVVDYRPKPSALPRYRGGYIDRNGTLVIPPIHEYVGNYREGLCVVADARKRFRCINPMGESTFTVRFSWVDDFHEGCAVVRDAGKMLGCIDTHGAVIIPPRFKWLGRFSQGLASASLTENPPRFGFVDKTGQFVIPPRFEEPSSFVAGLAPVREAGTEGRERSGYIDRTGRYAIELKDGFRAMGPFRGGLAAVHGPKGFCFIDRGGQTRIPGPFGFAEAFSCGLAAVQPSGDRTGPWGYIDKTGRFRIPPRFDNARSFSEGLAAVKVARKWGYVDQEGVLVIPARYTEASRFHHGLAVVELREDAGRVTRTSYIDRTGRVVWTTDNRNSNGFFLLMRDVF